MMFRPLVLSIAIHAIPVSLTLMQISLEMEAPPEMAESELEKMGGATSRVSLTGEAIFGITILEEAPPEKKPSKAKRVKKKAEAPIPEQPAPEVVTAATTAEPDPAPPQPAIEPAAPDVVPEATEEAVAAVQQDPAAAAPMEEAVTEEVECPPDRPGIVALSSSSWSVDRNLVDYYATHIRQLMKLAWVGVHKNESGDPDGFRIVLKECSILRNGGLQSQDVVVDVGGVRVHSVMSAIKAYFKLRKKEVIPLTVNRNGEILTLSYKLI